jgi:Protein of unknown function (DUF4236)
MGLRFRRSWSVIPGVRLNLGLKSGSLSFGMRGLHYTVGTKGSRVTVGLPGTGLFWTKKISPGFRGPPPPPNQQQSNLPPHSGTQAPQLRQAQAYSPTLGAGNLPHTGMQTTQQGYIPQTNPSPVGGNQISRFQAPQGAHTTQIPNRFTAQVPNQAGSVTHAQVFLPLWLVWSVLAMIIIAGLCLGAATLSAVLK